MPAHGGEGGGEVGAEVQLPREQQEREPQIPGDLVYKNLYVFMFIDQVCKI